MTKISFGSHPYLLGFEQLERLVERTAKGSGEGYPPFNIEAVAENAYRITLAVAGFREDALAITVEDRQLVIRGRQAEDEGELQGATHLALRQRRAERVSIRIVLGGLRYSPHLWAGGDKAEG